jgi:hypothetical protein
MLCGSQVLAARIAGKLEECRGETHGNSGMGEVVEKASLRSTMRRQNSKRRSRNKGMVVAAVDNSISWRIVMPDAKTIYTHKRAKKKRAGAADTYNPVNMSGKKSKTQAGTAHQEQPVINDYNPVNMAGKSAEVIVEDDTPTPVKK